MSSTVPLPRAPFDRDHIRRAPARCEKEAERAEWAGWAEWYEGLGWATSPGAPGEPPLLLTGARFDVLELPAGAGAAVLRRTGPAGPVTLLGERMGLLVAAGSADELPGLLDWLEWGGIALGMTALGAGGRMTAPAPPRWPGATAQGAAVWLRPPESGREVEPTLPALAPFGRGGGSGSSGGGAPDLVRLVAAAAAECHRARLSRRNTFRTNTQPLAFS
jgi:hypothetical protein